METQLQTRRDRQYANSAESPEAVWTPEPSAAPESRRSEIKLAHKKAKDPRSAVLHLADHNHLVPKGSLWTRGLLMAEAEILGEEIKVV